MTAVEALKRRESTAAPPGRDEARLGGPVEVPLADVVRGVPRVTEDLWPAGLGRRQLQVVLDHSRLVGITAGQDACPVRRAHRIGGIGTAPIGALLGEPVEMRGPDNGVGTEPERARSPLVGQDEQQVRLSALLARRKRRHAKRSGGHEGTSTHTRHSPSSPCAVERRCVLAGSNPARQLLLQPVAIGAVRGGNDTD